MGMMLDIICIAQIIKAILDNNSYLYPTLMEREWLLLAMLLVFDVVMLLFGSYFVNHLVDTIRDKLK